MAYKSFFKPRNKSKYMGDFNNIVCRSTWEYQLASWADRNSSIVKWGIESVILGYFDKGNGKKRDYYVDFYFEFNDGKKWLIEVKPRNQTMPPPKQKRLTRKYVNAVRTYATNTSKWEYARIFAEKNGMKFYVWTEDHLRKLGLNVL